MQKCWDEDPEARPTFSRLVLTLVKRVDALSSSTALSMAYEVCVCMHVWMSVCMYDCTYMYVLHVSKSKQFCEFDVHVCMNRKFRNL